MMKAKDKKEIISAIENGRTFSKDEFQRILVDALKVSHVSIDCDFYKAFLAVNADHVDCEHLIKFLKGISYYPYSETRIKFPNVNFIELIRTLNVEEYTGKHVCFLDRLVEAIISIQNLDLNSFLYCFRYLLNNEDWFENPNLYYAYDYKNSKDPILRKFYKFFNSYSRRTNIDEFYKETVELIEIVDHPNFMDLYKKVLSRKIWNLDFIKNNFELIVFDNRFNKVILELKSFSEDLKDDKEFLEKIIEVSDFSYFTLICNVPDFYDDELFDKYAADIDENTLAIIFKDCKDFKVPISDEIKEKYKSEELLRKCQEEHEKKYKRSCCFVGFDSEDGIDEKITEIYNFIKSVKTMRRDGNMITLTIEDPEENP